MQKNNRLDKNARHLVKFGIASNYYSNSSPVLLSLNGITEKRITGDEFEYNLPLFFFVFFKFLGGIPGMLAIKMYNLFIYKHNKKYKNSIKTG